MPGHEVRVQMSEEDVFDPQTMLGREGQVLIHVTLGIDDCRRLRPLVADQIRRMSETIQVELLEDHRSAIVDAAGSTLAKLPGERVTIEDSGGRPSARS